MKRYKNYALTGKPVPKSTLYYRRKKLREACAQQAAHPSVLVTQQQDSVAEEFVETSHHKVGALGIGRDDGEHGHEAEAFDTTQSTHHFGFGQAPYLPTDVDSSCDSDELPKNVTVEDPCKKRRKRRQRKKQKEEHGEKDFSFSSSNPDDSSSDERRSTVSSDSSLSEEEIQQSTSCVVEEEDEIGFVFNSIPKMRKSVPLYSGTDITVDDVVFMTLSLALRHNLSYVAQIDILKMFAVIFKDANIPVTKHMYLKQLNVQAEKDINFHVYCRECYSYLGERAKDMKNKCTVCEKDVDAKNADNYFVSLSIESQLQNYLKDEKFVNNILTYRFSNRPTRSDVLTDIYDGNVYKKLVADGVLSSPYNFSYTFFTDGVAYGRSSNKTVWPIYLTINELPYEERSKYLILAAVYSGSKDPNQRYFMKPFVAEANRLSNEGMKWVHEGETVTSCVIPLCCVCDSVARYQLINRQSFAAVFGCTFCYKRSVHEIGGQRYPVSAPAELRTDDSLRLDLSEVYEKRHNVQDAMRCHRGVKGPCNLMSLNYFSVSTSFVVDYMHAFLLGVTKTHTILLLQSIRRKMYVKEISESRLGMEHVIDSISAKILAIQSYSGVTRELRPLRDYKLWRASEWRAWIIFYCIPCLRGTLRDKFLWHLGLLSYAGSILLQKSITHDDVHRAHEVLMLYTFYFQRYFGASCMVYNVHLLSHICQGVLDFGPIVGHNSFVYESENRSLLALCKSPFSLSYQVCKKFITFRNLPVIAAELTHSINTIKFSENLLDYKKLVRVNRTADNTCLLLGKAVTCSLSATDQDKVSVFIHPYHCNDCLSYQRIIFKKKRYTTDGYSMGLRTNDSCALLFDGTYVIIKHILKLPSGKIIVVVQNVEVSKASFLSNAEHSIKISHILKVTGFSGITCVTLNCIAEPCFLMQTANGCYVAQIPYGCCVE